MSHVLLMSAYAFFVSMFFAALARRTRSEQVRLFWVLFGSLVGGAIALAWLMYFFPSGPPAPIP